LFKTSVFKQQALKNSKMRSIEIPQGFLRDPQAKRRLVDKQSGLLNKPTMGGKKMKQTNLMRLVFFMVISGCIFTSCPQSADEVLISLETYEKVGASLAEKKWSENYDCSNFATQFYQNCYKAGLPCRVRLGKSGGVNIGVGDHAWNSVKIDGTWVSWEPQLNKVYNDHTQTRTPIEWGEFCKEDIARIIYERIGKYVPKNIIDNYEIDVSWQKNSPFNQYFISQAYCVSNMGPAVQDIISFLETHIPLNNSADIFITQDYKHLVLYFKYDNKYYGIPNLETSDPVEGRTIATKELSLEEIIASGIGFTKLDITLNY
jgi:hypothetical protein